MVETRRRRSRGCHWEPEITPIRFPLSTTKIGSGPQRQPAAITIQGVPRHRPVFHPEFGETLKGLRESKGWRQREAADIAQRKGYRRLSRQIMLRLERGQVKNPNPDVLRDVAAFYGVEYAALAAQFTALTYGVRITVAEVLNPRADPTHAKKPYALTSSVPEDRVQHPPTANGILGEAAHGDDSAAAGTPDRLSKSQSARDVEVRNSIIADRKDIGRELIDRLTKAADDIRSVADALRTSDTPPPAGGARPGDAGSGPSVRPAGTRRGR
jgi:transcriptional regulator with XRE-family HTH domain